MQSLDTKGLTSTAQHMVSHLRDRVQDTLFQVVRELHSNNRASSRFGNLLLLIPTIMVSLKICLKIA